MLQGLSTGPVPHSKIPNISCGSSGCSFALELLNEDGKSAAVPLTRLLVAGGKFMYIGARSGTPLPRSPSFSALAETLEDDELRSALDFEISYGSM
jgi:hypothetical protein